jgi:hypothetical protein
METSISLIMLGGVAGLGIGAAYFALLYRAVRLHARAAPFHRVGPLHLARALLALGGFWTLVQLGAWPLLAGLAGFLAARLFAVRLQREA